MYGSFLGYLWCWVRQFIPSPTGRQRFNVLGALNAVTRELIVVTNDTYINAHSVAELILKVAQAVAAHGLMPITLILDNARYQRCTFVNCVVEVMKEQFNVDIELLYLPAYSPQLNLIERYWKFLKREVLYSRHYPNFTEFKAAILHCIMEPNASQKQRLTSLLTWRFQSFRKVHILPV